MAITPASIRNNNPGAMYPGKSAKKFGSVSFETLKSRDGVHKIATFPTPIHGAAAQFDLLRSAYCGMSIEAAIRKWCGGFYVTTYLKVLEQKTGAKPSDMLTEDRLRDSEFAIPLAKAMAWQEAGRDFPMDDSQWLDAHVMAFGDAVAPGWLPTNDVPSPRPEAREAANAMEVAKVVVPAAGLTGGVTLPSLPAPPDLSALKGWRSAIDAGHELIVWGAGNWPWVAGAVAVYVALAHGLPKIERFRS